MNKPNALLEKISAASIQYDSHPRGPDDELLHLFRIAADDAEEYFEAAYQFESNGDDFCVVISNFGMSRKTLVGSRTPLALKAFDADAIGAVRDRIKEYFAGSEEKNFPPFSVNRARFLKVVFAEGWIRATDLS